MVSLTNMLPLQFFICIPDVFCTKRDQKGQNCEQEALSTLQDTEKRQ